MSEQRFDQVPENAPAQNHDLNPAKKAEEAPVKSRRKLYFGALAAVSLMVVLGVFLVPGTGLKGMLKLNNAAKVSPAVSQSVGVGVSDSARAKLEAKLDLTDKELEAEAVKVEAATGLSKTNVKEVNNSQVVRELGNISKSPSTQPTVDSDRIENLLKVVYFKLNQRMDVLEGKIDYLDQNFRNFTESFGANQFTQNQLWADFLNDWRTFFDEWNAL